MSTYSKYKSRFFIDERLELFASNYVNNLSSSFILEGAMFLDHDEIRVWWQDVQTKEFGCNIVKLQNSNLFYKQQIESKDIILEKINSNVKNVNLKQDKKDGAFNFKHVIIHVDN